MSSEPGNESFFCALRPIQRILSLADDITRVKFKVASPRAPDANRFGAPCRCRRTGYGRSKLSLSFFEHSCECSTSRIQFDEKPSHETRWIRKE